MKQHLVLTLTDPKNTKKELQLRIDVLDSPVARKWFSQVNKCLDNKLYLEKNFCWLGWPDENRNVDFLKKRLEQCVNKINSFADNSVSWGGYRIHEDWEDISDHYALNKLHHEFEILMGQIWNVSEYMKSAPDAIKYEIRQLNNLVHELQSRKNVQGIPIENVYPMTIASYLNVDRELFQDDFFDYFDLNREFGTVYLHYSQTGKTPIEAYADEDEDVFDDNINALRYVSGEYNIWWGESMTPFEVKDFKQNVRMYLQERNLIKSAEENFNYYIDHQGNKQGIGYVPVAKVKNPYASNILLKQEILKKLNIHKLDAYQDSKLINSCCWNYSWFDTNYEQSQIEILKDHFPR